MAINKIPVKAFSSGDLATDVFTATAGQTAFTLSLSATDNSVIVYVNDVVQAPTTDYTVNGTTLTFTSGLTVGDEVIIRTIARPSVLNTVEDGAISSAKLATGAIESKLGYTPVSPTLLTTSVNTAVSNLVNAAPTTLDTLKELATALNNDASFATTVTNSLATKADTTTVNTALATKAPLQEPTFTGQYVNIPAGTTAQRPASATNGMLRYNTTSSVPEFYNGSAWVSIGASDGSSMNTAAPSASYLRNTLGITTSGVYWIKNSSMSTAVQVYCDLSYDSGGYMLLAYGYVGSTGDSSVNKAIPNLNHDGTAWSYNPTARSSQNGLIASPSGQKSALLLAKSATNMIMAAGSDPSTGGIDSYSYVYKFAIPSPSSLTFNNHSYYYNSGMTNSGGITITGLKGDIGSWTRYTIVEAIGASWGDSYPTGYGCVSISTPKSGTWDYGPFFPSIHSGSRNVAPSNPTVVTSSPDVGVNGYTAGAQSYTYRGWYGAGIGVNQTGQTSIWVK